MTSERCCLNCVYKLEDCVYGAAGALRSVAILCSHPIKFTCYCNVLISDPVKTVCKFYTRPIRGASPSPEFREISWIDTPADYPVHCENDD